MESYNLLSTEERKSGAETNFAPGDGNKMLLGKDKEVIGDPDIVIFTFPTTRK